MVKEMQHVTITCKSVIEITATDLLRLTSPDHTNKTKDPAEIPWFTKTFILIVNETNNFYAYVTPRVHILPQLVGAGLEPGIPVREAGALTSNAKGYSL